MIVFYPVCLLRFNPLFSIFLLVLFIQCCNAGVVEYRWNMLVFYSASSVAVQNMLLLQAAGRRQAERLTTQPRKRCGRSCAREGTAG